LSQEDLKVLYTPDKYVCKLSDELKKIAKKELREDDKVREQALAQMRDWISKTNYIRDCRVDSNFLLRFLRVKKFSVPLAQETLLKYIAMRQQHTHWFHSTTIADPLVLDLVNRGVAFALPGRDKFGRRVMFTVGGNIDSSYHTSESVMKAIMLTFESMLEDEETQIRGFSHILDESGITLSHLTLWNPTDLSKIFGTCEKAMPMRHKRLDFVRLPTLLNYVYEFATNTLMSEKLRNRIKLHKDSASLMEHVDPKILPKEYGGVIPMADMIQMFKEEIASRDARVLALDRMNLDLDLVKKSNNAPKSLCNDILGMSGSFKKLDID
jgi:hypothetical protein